MSFAAQITEKATTIWHIQRVKRLVRDLIAVGPLTLITVVEIDCDDPNCPGPATQITVLAADLVRRRATLHLSVHDIQEADLSAAFF